MLYSLLIWAICLIYPWAAQFFLTFQQLSERSLKMSPPIATNVVYTLLYHQILTPYQAEALSPAQIKKLSNCVAISRVARLPHPAAHCRTSEELAPWIRAVCSTDYQTQSALDVALSSNETLAQALYNVALVAERLKTPLSVRYSNFKLGCFLRNWQTTSTKKLIRILEKMEPEVEDFESQVRVKLAHLRIEQHTDDIDSQHQDI